MSLLLRQENFFQCFIFPLALVIIILLISGSGEIYTLIYLSNSSNEKATINKYELGENKFIIQQEHCFITSGNIYNDDDIDIYLVTVDSDFPQGETDYIWILSSLRNHKPYYWHNYQLENKVEKKFDLNKINSGKKISSINLFNLFFCNANSNLKSHPPPFIF